MFLRNNKALEKNAIPIDKETPEEQQESSVSLQEKTLENVRQFIYMSCTHVEERSSSVASTYAALKASQKTLEKTEAALSETTHALQKTQQKLDEHVTAHQVATSKLLNQTVQMHAAQTKVVAPLLKVKDEEIAGLRHTLRVINKHVGTLQKEGVFGSKSNGCAEKNLNLNGDHTNTGVKHVRHNG